MSITLNHMIIPSSDKHAGAAFLAGLLGLAVGEPAGPFVPVQVNADLTLDFDDRRGATAGHYAFLVDDDTFDAVMERLDHDRAIRYGSGVEHGWDRRINHTDGGRGVYVGDPDGHSYELLTRAPA